MGDSEIGEVLSLVDSERIVGLSKELIRIPSVTGEERAVVQRARMLLESSGVHVDLRGPGERPVINAIINPDAERLLAFNGHLDTVPVARLDAWTKDPFDPVVEEGRLYGRGSSDMKASCAVIIHVMELLGEMGLPIAVGAQLVPDEEKGGEHGTKLLIKEMDADRLRRPDYVVIGEKSNLKVSSLRGGASASRSGSSGGRATPRPPGRRGSTPSPRRRRVYWH